MTIIEYSDYKAFLRAKFKMLPGHGRGQSTRLAEQLNVVPMVVSSVLNRDRHFTPDQAFKVADFFGLEPREKEYFVYMVHLARAEGEDSKALYQRRLDEIREADQSIKNHVAAQEELSGNNTGIYYSNWYYCGIWLLVSIKGYQDVNSIATYFGLSRARVAELVAFLVDTGLCVHVDGLIKPGKTAIHVGKQSELVNSHHRNWREKAREKFTEPDPKDLFFSAPVSISEKDAGIVHKEILKLIDSFSERVKASPEQALMCLNIDWFKF